MRGWAVEFLRRAIQAVEEPERVPWLTGPAKPKPSRLRVTIEALDEHGAAVSALTYHHIEVEPMNDGLTFNDHEQDFAHSPRVLAPVEPIGHAHVGIVIVGRAIPKDDSGETHTLTMLR